MISAKAAKNMAWFVVIERLNFYFRFAKRRIFSQFRRLFQALAHCGQINLLSYYPKN
jgi:hypothetical protein